jgi:hypothetical protein
VVTFVEGVKSWQKGDCIIVIEPEERALRERESLKRVIEP